MGSEGRRNAAYIHARRVFQQGNHPCWLQYPGCTGIGLTVDHDPPLDGTNPTLWHGTYRPACQPCQSRQGAAITNTRNHWQY